ncbi:pore-forming ESAT-6 family protein [Nesterenkonia cremea]|uniref:ESAT-6-like protein n=1 Tax=Nesterenkonia cremea TaxID=1882340 RepID=A0A917AM75_9MICC|nr:pore-forming ESAT-6 family protein [Nesterenkonia cremea]GGE60680.1 hypothetical protein GCM10011401_04500 [Nesterenkonia cremea]
MPNVNRISYDTNVSADVEGNINKIAGQLQAQIGARRTQVEQAMSDFQADGVDEEYRTIETSWNSAADEVESIIRLVKDTLEKNDTSAETARSQALNAVSGIR